jgi:hypothetical protein
MRDLFVRLAREADVADASADALAVQLSLLYDGASVMGQIEGSPRAAVAAREAAAVLLDHASSRNSTSAKSAKPRRS